MPIMFVFKLDTSLGCSFMGVHMLGPGIDFQFPKKGGYKYKMKLRKIESPLHMSMFGCWQRDYNSLLAWASLRGRN